MRKPIPARKPDPDGQRKKSLDLFFLMITFMPAMTAIIKYTKQTKKQFPHREGV
jgi:hypothetical protein